MANIFAHHGAESGESYWRRQIGLCEASGKSITQYCRDAGLSAARYHWWKARLRRREALERVPACFAEVRVVAPDAALIEVSLRGDRQVRVWPGFDSETLCRVVRALEDVSC